MIELLGGIISFVFEIVGFVLEIVFGAIGFAFELLGGILALAMSLGGIILVLVLIHTFIQRRSKRREHLLVDENGETFVSFYDQQQ